VAACIVCYLAGWRGTDWAAQIYRAGEVTRYGLVVWDPGWYGGTFPLNYSLLYPLAAGYLGLWPVAAVSAGAAAFCFDRLLRAGLPRPALTAVVSKRPLASWYFAASTVVAVAIGQLPTMAGEALALGSALCLAQRARVLRSVGRELARQELAGQGLARQEPAGRAATSTALAVAGLVLGIMAGLTTPIAGAFLALALVAWGVADFGRGLRRRAGEEALAGAVILASTAALPLAFAAPGYFFFPVGDLVVVLAISALLASPLLGAPHAVRVGAVLYGAVSVALFAVPTQVGDNDVRFAAYIGIPLVLFYLGTSRLRNVPAPKWAQIGLAGTVTLGLVGWAWAPIAASFSDAANGPVSAASYYQPLLKKLEVLSHGLPTRVEIPPTEHHWESAYVAPTFPLARGWERQLDVVYGSLFYGDSVLRPGPYRSWLVSNGVSYVALPNAPLDFGATAEATLLRSGKVRGLEQVWRTDDWCVWKVTGTDGLASAPARVTSLKPAEVTAVFARAGSTVLKLRWSRYWSLAAHSASTACVQPSGGGWTQLISTRAGPVELTTSVLAAAHGSCSATLSALMKGGQAHRAAGDVRSG
jgi:hypothetical protein